MNKMNFRNSKGFTIIELVITMVLIGIVAYIAADAMSTGFKAFFVTDNRKEALDQARLAMERMTREIRNTRGSSDISTADATTFTFTDISGTTITFTLNAGNINRTSGTTNTLATGISNSTLPSGIFSYTLTTGAVTQTPTPAERLLIKRIKIDFKATTNNENVALQSEVWLRNL